MCNCLAKLALCLVLVAGMTHAETLRDPTRPVGGASVSQKPPLVLHSVLTGGDRRLAVINGALVREGQILPGRSVVVEQIEPARVIVRDGKMRRTLRIAKDYLTPRAGQADRPD